MTEDPQGSVDIVGSEASFISFLPQALALTNITPFRAEIAVVVPNVNTGVAHVVGKMAGVAVLGVTPAQVQSVWELVLALAFATSAVHRLMRKSPGEIRVKLKRGRQLRRAILHALESCHELELISADDINHLREGSGAIDAAQDLIDGAAAFHRLQLVLANKTPITPELLREAQLLGVELLGALKPASVAPDAELPPELAQAVDARDRLWTLLLQLHEAFVWKVGAQLYGKEVDEYVPRLQARIVVTSVKKPEPVK